MRGVEVEGCLEDVVDLRCLLQGQGLSGVFKCNCLLQWTLVDELHFRGLEEFFLDLEEPYYR